MSALLQEYLPLVIFIAVAMVLGLGLLVAPFLVCDGLFGHGLALRYRAVNAQRRQTIPISGRQARWRTGGRRRGGTAPTG